MCVPVSLYSRRGVFHTPAPVVFNVTICKCRAGGNARGHPAAALALGVPSYLPRAVIVLIRLDGGNGPGVKRRARSVKPYGPRVLCYVRDRGK